MGHGILGNGGTYWNGLNSANNFNNTLPSRWDDGVTPCPVNVGPTNYPYSDASTAPYNSLLLDQYFQVGTNGTSMVFTGVPAGRYNLALYGICGSWANRGIAFSVQGVSQSVTNAQDLSFLPDNTVVYSNLLVTSGTLEVHMTPGWTAQYGATNTEGDFNGAQLQFVSGPLLVGMTNRTGTNVLTYYGGFVLQSTNMAGPWTTNTTVYGGSITIMPTNAQKFFKVWTNKPIN